MKSQKRRLGTPLSSAIGVFFVCALSLLGCALVAAAVLTLLERPVAAIAAAALATSILSGAISGVFTRKNKNGWMGAVAFVALWVLTGVICTKGHFPATALVGAAAFLACHLLLRLVPKKKKKRRKI